MWAWRRGDRKIPRLWGWQSHVEGRPHFQQIKITQGASGPYLKMGTNGIYPDYTTRFCGACNEPPLSRLLFSLLFLQERCDHPPHLLVKILQKATPVLPGV